MSKVRVLLVVAFMVVFAAGAVVGLARKNEPAANPTPPPPPFPDLHLSATQQEQMKTIWSTVVSMHRQSDQQRHKIDQEREASILAMLNSDQKSQYQQIQQTAAAQVQALEQQMQRAIHEAEDRTRAILSPPQQQTFEKIRKDRDARRGRHRHGSATEPSGPPSPPPPHENAVVH